MVGTFSTWHAFLSHRGGRTPLKGQLWRPPLCPNRVKSFAPTSNYAMCFEDPSSDAISHKVNCKVHSLVRKKMGFHLHQNCTEPSQPKRLGSHPAGGGSPDASPRTDLCLLGTTTQQCLPNREMTKGLPVPVSPGNWRSFWQTRQVGVHTGNSALAWL